MPPKEGKVLDKKNLLQFAQRHIEGYIKDDIQTRGRIVKAGLSINSPVATLNLSKWSNYKYEWHWMTITGYYRDSTDSRWIVVSTWGNVVVLITELISTPLWASKVWVEDIYVLQMRVDTLNYELYYQHECYQPIKGLLLKT